MMYLGRVGSARAQPRHRARGKRSRAWMLCGLAVAFLAGLPLTAQEQEAEAATTMIFGGLDILFAQPTGEFAENVESGWGAGIWGRLPFDPNDRVSLRLDLGFLNYGNETIRICVTQPCRVTGDLTTSNNIFFGGIGPELGLGGDAARLFANAGIGFAYFATTSSVEGSRNDGEPFASSTNFDDLTFAWTAGGGGAFRLAGGRTPVYLNLGVRYHGNGDARYLRKGDIRDLPDGNVETDPRHSDTNLWTYQLGVSIGFGMTEER